MTTLKPQSSDIGLSTTAVRALRITLAIGTLALLAVLITT